MRQFSGCEPLVGEVIGLRTFRAEESGLLLPLYSNTAWYNGANAAECAPPAGGRTAPHPIASPECECGFYAYGSEPAAARNRNMRFVQAVVSCWGSVVAGTQGVRAEYARIDALWLHESVPPWLRARILARYPSARLYASREAMLAEHTLSVLPCYEPPERAPLAGRIALAAFGAAVLVLGVLPWSWLTGPLRYGWLAVLAWLCAAIVVVCARPQLPGKAATNALILVAIAWLVAPMFGLYGWVLRVPVLRGAVVAGGGWLLAKRPGYFPVVKSVRERAFCGVRP